MSRSMTQTAVARIERALERIERATATGADTEADTGADADRAALAQSNARLKDGLRAAIADIDRLLATEPEKVG